MCAWFNALKYAYEKCFKKTLKFCLYFLKPLEYNEKFSKTIFILKVMSQFKNKFILNTPAVTYKSAFCYPYNKKMYKKNPLNVL